MSRSPNLFVAAIIKPICSPEHIENWLDEKFPENREAMMFDSEFSIETSESDSGVPIEDGSFTIFKYLTYGWGHTIRFKDLDSMSDDFVCTVEDFCDEYACTYKTVYGANFW